VLGGITKVHSLILLFEPREQEAAWRKWGANISERQWVSGEADMKSLDCSRRTPSAIFTDSLDEMVSGRYDPPYFQIVERTPGY
jgi:hypothetical protein